MQRCSFALTALDVRMVEPVQSLDQLNVPEWSRGSALAKVPVVRLFGISRQGASVCAHVHGCWPFFYVELSEEAAARLGSKSHSCTEELMTEEIARPRELAAAIEDAAQRARPAKPVKVVNLRLERWRSIYGLRITPSPFLRVELTDARDVEMVAGLLQSNEVEAIGFAQAHEAHLPFLLHFLAEHHLSGAGLCRVSGTERASRLSRCALELDVVAPEGLVNSLEYRELLRRAGQGSEARALSALRSQLGRQYNQLPSPSAGHVSVSRPGAAARTPAAVRHALHRWLRGGAAPVHEASEAFTEMAMEMANAWKIAQEKVQDIEDLAGKAGRRRRRPASPARYSNPADDPRSKDHSAATKALPPQTGRPEAPRGSEPAQAPKRPPVSAEHAEWEDLAAFLAVEVLTVQASGQKKQEAVGQQLVAVCYALRPHGCLLGGRQMRLEDQRGALVVSHDRWEEERWQEDLKQMKLELRRVNSEEELLEALVELVQNADPDVCLGWDVRSRSWGLLAARAKALGRQDLRTALSRVPYDATSLPLSALASSPPLSGQGQDLRTLESEMVAPSDLQLPGRMLLNVWRLLMHLTFGAKLRSFAPQEAARELLGRSFPKISLQEMDEHWSKGSSSLRLALLQHVADLAALSLEISDVLEIFPRAGELSRLFGMDILSGFTRGTQLRVESLLMRVAHADGFRLLSASQEQVRAQPALECLPLVMEPCSGFYWDPVLVLDFKGMYPSLIVAHNLSFDTCLGHSRRTGEGPSCQMGVLNGPWVLNGSSLADLFDSEDPADAPVRLAASGALFASPQVRTGLLPLMLDEVLKLRAETKRQAKQSSPAVAKRLEHKQFALKYFANVTYGYSSASFSGRMPCSELADAIVATGRRALEEAANFIEANWEGAKIVYGDTDSVFVQLKGYSLEEAFGAGREICAKVSAKHPAPVELEFEKVYMPCLCLTKKRYGGLAYAKAPSEGGVGRFEAKGLEAIRRDQCRMASNVQNEVLNDFFRSKDLSGVKQIFMSHAVSLLKGGAFGHTVADLSFFREARLGTYRAEADDGGSATLPPQAAVAMNRIATEGDAVAPSFGERISFAVALDDVGARLVDRSVFPAQLAEAGAGSSASRLDRWWYVEKALLPAIRRILHSDLVGLPPNLDVTAWLRQVPRPSASSRGAPGPLGRLLRPSCRKCGEKVLCGELCRACASPALRAELQESLQQSRQAAEELWKQCADCAGPLWRSCRAAEFCPVRTRRAEAETELQRLQTLIRELEPPEEATGADDWKHQDTLVFDIASGSEEADMEVEAASSTVKCEGGDDQPTLSVSSDDDLGPPSPAGRGPSASGGVPSAGVAGFVPPEPPEPERPSSLPLCKHQELCREVEVKKEGPNKGRHFFVCPRVREEQCDFFAWADRALPTSSRNAPGGPSTPPPKTRKKTDVKTTPAKRRRMTQASREGRLERFVATPSRRVKERIERAKEHRLLLVNLKVVERGEIAAAVVGHTGNVYDVRVGARVLCTCLDFVKARSACKHLLFLFLRVFQLPDDDPRLWQRALLARELSELRHRLETLDLTEVQAPEHVVSASRAPVLREAAGRPCPVCFDPVVHLAGSCCCAGCGRNLHAECLEQWRTGTSSSRHNLLDCLVLSGVRSTLSCPLCAAPAETTATHRVEALQAVAATKASPGQPLRRHVNVSSVSELHSDPKSLEETYPETFKWIARKGARTETTETRSDPSGGPQTGSV